MFFYIYKVLVTSVFIVLITEIAKRSDKFGGLIAALPLTTILIISWMSYEGVGNDKIAKHMLYTLFFVIPTLPMFIIFPFLIGKFGFFWALILSIILTAVLLICTDKVLKNFSLGLV